MAQPENLLAAFNVEGKRSADFWQQRMMALTAGGLDEFRTTLKAALESGDATVVQEAQRALGKLRQIANILGVTREAIVTAFSTLQSQYIGARNATAQGMHIKRETPAAQVYRRFPELYTSCHAHAQAALPVMEEKAKKPTTAPVATQAPNTAPTPANRGEKPAPQPAAAKAPVAAKTARKPATASDVLTDATIAPTLQPTRPAAPAKPEKPAQKPAGKPATKPAVTGEIGLATEPDIDFSPVETPEAGVPTGMDDIDPQPDEDLERLLGFRTDSKQPKKPGPVDPSRPKR